MRKQLELDRSLNAKAGAFDVFTSPSNRKRALFAFGFMFGNMFTVGHSYTLPLSLS